MILICQNGYIIIYSVSVKLIYCIDKRKQDVYYKGFLKEQIKVISLSSAKV